ADSNQCNTPVTVVDSSNNIVFSEKNQRIALLGVEDLIVVQTDDAILVANRHRADEIRKIVQELPEELL
ncbi:MAG: mannose-1-phosphate guanyltransferase, partial [Roseibacillus sp.]|nr:mannose-1-phosphate guanyltransferase [Roseibacillus sp.]